MFINYNHLNEGSSIKGSGDEQKKSLNEGESPRAEINKDTGTNWKGSRSRTHVNHIWEKLRSK